jgi:hypothetical protein
MHRFSTPNNGKDPGSFLLSISWDRGPDLSPSPIPQEVGTILLPRDGFGAGQKSGKVRHGREIMMAGTRLECCMIATVLMLVLAAGVHAIAFP